MRLIYILCALVLGVASIEASQFPHVNVYGVEGVIVPAEFAEKNKLPFDGFWTPEIDQLEELERRLPEFLKVEIQSHGTSVDYAGLLSKAAKSRRQYLGIIRQGKKLIRVNCFPEKPLNGEDSFADWDCNIIVVRHGGSDFWGVIYDSEAHSFTDLTVDGTG